LKANYAGDDSRANCGCPEIMARLVDLADGRLDGRHVAVIGVGTLTRAVDFAAADLVIGNTFTTFWAVQAARTAARPREMQAAVGEFSHRDGSPLCCGVGGRAVDPVELVVVVG
jgi:hypothetical protein